MWRLQAEMPAAITTDQKVRLIDCHYCNLDNRARHITKGDMNVTHAGVHTYQPASRHGGYGTVVCDPVSQNLPDTRDTDNYTNDRRRFTANSGRRRRVTTTNSSMDRRRRLRSF